MNKDDFKYKNKVFLIISLISAIIMIVFAFKMRYNIIALILIEIVLVLIMSTCLLVYMSCKKRCERNIEEFDKLYSIERLILEANNEQSLLFNEYKNDIQCKGKLFITNNYIIYINNELSFVEPYSKITSLSSINGIIDLNMSKDTSTNYESIKIGTSDGNFYKIYNLMSKIGDQSIYNTLFSRIKRLSDETENAIFVYNDIMYQLKDSFIFRTENEISKIRFDEITSISKINKLLLISDNNKNKYRFIINLTENEYFNIISTVSGKNPNVSIGKIIK